MMPATKQREFDFSGRTYSPQRDKRRLNRQLQKVFNLMQDGTWRSLSEIALATGEPEASVSARLRDIRNQMGLTVDRKRVTDGLNVYKVAR